MSTYAKIPPLGQATLSYADFTCVPPTARTGAYSLPCGVKSAAGQQAVAALYGALNAVIGAWNAAGRNQISLTLPSPSTLTTTTAGAIASLLSLFPNNADAQGWIAQLTTGANWVVTMPALTALLQQLAAQIQPAASANFVMPTAPVAKTASKGGFVFVPRAASAPTSPSAVACPPGLTYDAASGGCVAVATPPPSDAGGGGDSGGGGGGATPTTVSPTVTLSPLANVLMNMTPDQFAQQWQTLATQAGVSSSDQSGVLDMLQAIVMGQSSVYPPGQLGLLAQALQQIPQGQALADIAAARATISTFPWVTVGLVAVGLLAAGGVAWWLWGRQQARA